MAVLRWLCHFRKFTGSVLRPYSDLVRRIHQELILELNLVLLMFKARGDCAAGAWIAVVEYIAIAERRAKQVDRAFLIPHIYFASFANLMSGLQVSPINKFGTRTGKWHRQAKITLAWSWYGYLLSVRNDPATQSALKRGNCLLLCSRSYKKKCLESRSCKRLIEYPRLRSPKKRHTGNRLIHSVHLKLH
jgi:hypothetical protein